ncbi:LD-carboxypeptidase [Neisseria leonii]|uniref:LD-carboxypeptidase n=1 Tax=Neisseria leonii TaxID=2995413 RepID=A0A9X4E1B6_9NEIS|nr:LD-carboxypeptidase [Neisseria sp. 51.81]MDD9326944.1 LD-carboxypeptidase [Neisseria sp. 51.81]
MNIVLSRRSLLHGGAALAGSGLLAACAAPVPKPAARPATPASPVSSGRVPSVSGNTVLRIIASSGFGSDGNRIQTALNRLSHAGFSVTNHQAAYRRFQRFAGTDQERIADFQDIAAGKAATPKVIMGFRGGYGAHRLLPYIDFASLGARMREQGTLFFGFSDVCALQLALLAKGKMMSFAGPMAYSEFGRPVLSDFTMDSFIRGSTDPNHTIHVFDEMQTRPVQAEGVFWGGNLSVLAALAGSPYLPDINGGILFLEDVGEQPYRIERMLQTLLLAGVLQKQQAVILGDFRMGSIRDVYDGSYTLSTVAAQISRTAKVPVLSGFPFGHIANKATFPLGAHAKLRSSGNGYSVQFGGYPTLNPSVLALDTLRPPAVGVEAGGFVAEDSAAESD